MGLVMLDPMNLDRGTIDPEHTGDGVLDGRETASCPESARRIRRHPKTVPCLLEKTRPRIARHRQSFSLARQRPRGIDHVAQRLGGKSGAMLDAVEALFLGGGNQLPVGYKCRTRIAVIGI